MIGYWGTPHEVSATKERESVTGLSWLHYTMIEASYFCNEENMIYSLTSGT
jgi:hypothetical protein